MSVAPDANRLQVLRATQLLDSEPEPAFDRLTRLAASLTGAPIALVSLVDDRRQFFKSAFGLKEPLATQRGTPLSHSFCRHVARDRAPLVVADAREHSALRDNPVIRDHNVIAYAGVPLVIDDEAIGAFCVIDDKPHAWHPDSIRVLEDLAASVVSEIRLRTALRDLTDKKREVDFSAALARNLPRGAVVLFDRDLRCLAVDGGLLRADGVSPQALTGRSMRDIAGYSAGDPGFDRVEELYRQALSGETVAIDFQNGGRMLALTAAPVNDTGGEIIAGIVLAMDVTHERQLETALRRSEQIHRAIVQNLPNGAVFMFDRDLRYVSADGPLLSEMMRRSDLESIVGRRVADIVSPVNRDAVLEQYQRALAGERSNSEIERDGRFFEVSVVPISEGDQINYALVSSYDVTDRRREAVELRQARDSFAREQALLDTTLAHIADGVALIDADNRIVVANRAFGEMMALPVDQVMGLSRERFVRHVAPLLATPEGFADALAAQPENVSQEFGFARPRRRILTRTWTSVGAGSGDGILVTWHDVTAERDLLREREELLLVDALTSIPNRRAGETALRTEQQRMQRAGTPMCVALLDIDHFKKVNDLFGHAAGDKVLRIVAGTLAGEARLTDTVARWGGEEFLAVVNVPLEGARIFCERMRAVVEGLHCPPVDRITISIGIAQVGPGEALADTLARADKRLYEAKSGGRNRVCC